MLWLSRFEEVLAVFGPTVETIHQYAGQTVRLKGWLYNKRGSGKLHFLQLRDGTGTIQCVVFKGDVDPEMFETAGQLSQECSVWVEGEVKEDTRSSLGYELGVKALGLIGDSQDFPITPKEHGVGFLMDHRHLWLRSSKQHAALRIRAEVVRAIREYFDSHGFLNVDSPIFTPNACEGTSNLFETDYFEDRKAYLTQSGQLYAESSAAAFGKVYCFGPTFRAEKSKTRRHLTEFWMVEPEMAFVEHDDNLKVAEGLVVHIVQSVLKNRRPELETLERDISKLEAIQLPFPRVTYTEAINLLHGKGFTEVQHGDDFGADEETAISESYDRPVIIERYPATIKPFYMKRDPENPDVVLNMDIIAPEGYGEMIGGSQREDDLVTLEAGLEAHDLDKKVFSWYLDLRRYGSFPHSGFGLGVERTVAWICGLKHVRETIPYPRLMDRLYP